jgi:hypothetical protein
VTLPVSPAVDLRAAVAEHLRAIVAFGGRPPGSPANRAATAYVAGVLEGTGGTVSRLPFEATWWRPGEAVISAAGRSVAIPPPPFSRPVDAGGAVVPARSLADVGRAAPGSILVLEGELGREPYFPRAFPFLSIAGQLEVLAALEAAAPLAVVAVSDDAAGRPVFEDPDLPFAYATVGPEVGRLLADAGTCRITLTGSLDRGIGENVSARRGDRTSIVVSAHLDSKVTTPGALDNGGGVAAVLAAAEAGLLEVPGLEVVLFNGEDHYAAPGEQAWLAVRPLDEIRLAANVDGVGTPREVTEVSALAFPERLAAALAAVLEGHPDMAPGEPWFESDHAVFAMRGIPSLALTSGGPRLLLHQRSHSPAGGLQSVDAEVLASVAAFLLEAMPRLGEELD